MSRPYSPDAPSRAEVDAWSGVALLDFGTSWCGHCNAAQPLVDQALAGYPQVRHLRVEDGPGRPLGRSFGVKLWPTLVLLRDGREIARLVRPRGAREVADALAAVGR
jgi:thioredoxin 1